MKAYSQLRGGLLGAVMLAGLGAAGVSGATTLERIQSAGAVNFGYIDGAAPLSSKAGDNQAIGYSIELCQQVATALKSQLGMSALSVNFVQVADKDVKDKIEKGEIDLLCTATAETLERRKDISYSVPVINGGIGVALRTDASPALINVLNGKMAHSGPTWRATINQGLANHTYVVRKGEVSEAWVEERIHSLGVIAKVVVAADYAEGVAMVADGKADAFFGERTVLSEYASKSKDANELTVLDRDFTYVPLALAMARNDDDFRLAVDKALSEFYGTTAFTELYQRYFGAFDENKQKLFKIYARH